MLPESESQSGINGVLFLNYFFIRVIVIHIC